MPVFKSDRISVQERKDKKSYKHNLRKIRANLPDEPWTKIKKVDVLFPVNAWDQAVNDKVEEVMDNIDYPFRLVMINSARTPEAQCWDALGLNAELKNIRIVTPPRPLDLLDAYRFAAQKSRAHYVFLMNLDTKIKEVEKRIISGVNMLENKRQKHGVKWDVPEEKDSPLHILIRRNLFLSQTNGKKRNKPLDIWHIKNLPPSSYKFDVLFASAKRHFAKGELQAAYSAMQATLALEEGAPGPQYLVDLYTKVCIEMGKYDELETMLRDLLDRGFVQDNFIRLGRVLQKQKRYTEAIEAFQKGLAQYNLDEAALDNALFPMNFPKELSSFHALMGLAESYDGAGDAVTGGRYYHLAAKLRANSHRPWLGFAKQFMAAGQIREAERVLRRIAQREGKNDPETHRVLGRLCYLRKDLKLAFECYLRACEVKIHDADNIDPLFFTGRALGRMPEVRDVLVRFVEARPDYAPALARLAEVHLHLGQVAEAREAIDQGLALDPNNRVLGSLSRRAAALGPAEEKSTSLESGIEFNDPFRFSLAAAGD
jgi:tetratricopeptide (TPR) repeat protein